MIKTAFSFLTSFICLAAFSRAGTVVGQADDRNGFSLADGADLAPSNLVRLGFFNLSDAVIQTSALAFLDQNFVEFGAAHIGDSYPGVAGHFDRAINANADAKGIAGKQIYMWVFASTDNSTPARSLATAYQHGVFYMDKAMDSDWTFKAEADIPNSTTIYIAELTGASDALLAGAHVVVGKFDGTSGISDATGGRNFALALTIPEPSAAVIAAAGGVMLLMRRRVRS